MQILHGEEALEIYKSIPTNGKFTAQTKIENLFDKGGGAVVVTVTNFYDEKGDIIVKKTSHIFIRGLGNFGGERGPSRLELLLLVCLVFVVVIIIIINDELF